MGDPAGIGLEVTLKSWQMRRQQHLPPFVLFASVSAVEATAKEIGLDDLPIQPIDTLADTNGVFETALPVSNIALPAPAIPGKPNRNNATAILASIEAAVDAVLFGTAGAVVTSPISKSVLYQAGFEYPGHTEFLAALADRKARPPSDASYTPVMMLMGQGLRVVPATIHIPLSRVTSKLTTDSLTQTIRIVADALKSDFGIDAPRIAVAGLNPHAGEDGAMGLEDQTIISPAIARARTQGLSVTGPHPADTLFHAAARETYDAAVCMYHDQALIPLKTLAFDEGVNITLGLPFVRTSPDHGTAFNIAGQNRASPASMIAALHVAQSMAQHRGARTMQRSPP